MTTNVVTFRISITSIFVLFVLHHACFETELMVVRVDKIYIMYYVYIYMLCFII